jgi:hypothetical protein
MVDEFTNFVLFARWRDCENTSQAVEGGRRPQLEGQQLLAGQHSGQAFCDVPISVQILRVCQTCAFPVLSKIPCVTQTCSLFTTATCDRHKTIVARQVTSSVLRRQLLLNSTLEEL